jgi:hypothetical protein
MLVTRTGKYDRKNPQRQAQQDEGLAPGQFLRRGGSKLAEQNQDQQDNDYEAEAAATVVTGPVERAAPEAAKAPEQQDYQNDEQDDSD